MIFSPYVECLVALFPRNASSRHAPMSKLKGRDTGLRLSQRRMLQGSFSSLDVVQVARRCPEDRYWYDSAQEVVSASAPVVLQAVPQLFVQSRVGSSDERIMATNLSLCSFCRFIPLDVNTLERLRLSPRAKSTLDNKEKPRPTPTRLDVGRNTLKLGARSTFALGKAERVFGSDCPFCKIVSMAVTELKRVVVWRDLRDDTPLKLTWTNKGPESKSVFRVNDHETVYICFVRQLTFSHNQLDWPSACYIHPVQPRIDLSQIREWIDHCQAFHGPDCNSPIGDTGHIRDFYRGLEVLRFVDVRRKCLVETYQNVRYVALSYVWGAVATVRLTTMNKAQMQTPYILSKLELPTTIWDAIDLVQGCGERYLWVDSLCIVQNDPMDLEGGTQVMDLVYERAVFTIVAACGSDAGYGLPGLHSGTRLPPPYMEVAPGVRLGVVSEVDALVEASCYSTRGWTYVIPDLSKNCAVAGNDPRADKRNE